MGVHKVSKSQATNACKEMLTSIGVSNIEVNAHSKSLLLFGDLDDNTKILGICSFFNGTITDSIVEALPIIIVRIDSELLQDISFNDIIQMIRTANVEKGGDELITLIATIIGIIGASESGRVLDGCIMQTVSKKGSGREADVKAGVILYESSENVVECKDVNILECYYTVLTNNELNELRTVDRKYLTDVVRIAGFERRVVGREIDTEVDISNVMKSYANGAITELYQSVIDTLIEEGKLGYGEDGNLSMLGYTSRKDFIHDLEDILMRKVEGNDDESNDEEDEEEC